MELPPLNRTSLLRLRADRGAARLVGTLVGSCLDRTLTADASAEGTEKDAVRQRLEKTRTIPSLSAVATGSGIYRYLVAVTALVSLAVGGASLLGSYLPPLGGIALTPVISGLAQPTAGAPQPGTDRMFITERAGRVWVIEDGWVAGLPAIDLLNKVESGFTDQGLLGIAFHPRYPDDRRAFLSYTEVGSEAQVVYSFVVGPDGLTLDVDSAVEILRVPQPHMAHQGGTIRFGPDGMLWAGFGDGGFIPPDTGAAESQDPLRHGQNRFTLPGSVVRIDVDTAVPYAIPPDNPFANGANGLPEIWAYGVRNPWGLWFDHDSVVIGDVGNLRWDEIDRLDRHRDAGANLGWSDVEGPECFADRDCSATAESAISPWMALPHTDACAVIAGPVYRGWAMPELAGELFFADFCRGWIRSISIEAPDGATPTRWAEDFGENPTAFIIGPHDEIYLLTFQGNLFRIDPVR